MFYIRVFNTIYESIACRVLLNYIISTIKSRQSSFEISTQCHVHPEKIIFLRIKSAIFWMNLVTRAFSSIIICTRICQASRFRREANETCAQRLIVEMRLHCSSTTLIRHVSDSVSYREIAINVKIVSFTNFMRANDFTIWSFDLCDWAVPTSTDNDDRGEWQVHTFQNGFVNIHILRDVGHKVLRYNYYIS